METAAWGEDLGQNKKPSSDPWLRVCTYKIGQSAKHALLVLMYFGVLHGDSG